MGCRPGGVECTYLFAKCSGINHISDGDSPFCFECDQYPCKQINRMDDRYRKNYGMSVKSNLEDIKILGVDKFVESQYKKYQCSTCGGMISVHNGKCFQCETVTKLIEKRSV